MSAADHLRRARARLAHPGAWTKETSARDMHGREVAVNDGAAVCWCAMGAVWADGVAASNAATPFLKAAVDGGRVAKFNDAPETTHADILALYDRAIALAEAS